MKETDLRYTPDWLADGVRLILGGIDLDPASDATGNLSVRAVRYLECAGEVGPWWGRVWLNWPGSQALAFSRRLREEVEAGRVTAAAVMIFNWDHTTKWFRDLQALTPTYVMLPRRVKFAGPDGKYHEVGRSQALALVGAYDIRLVYSAFPQALILRS